MQRPFHLKKVGEHSLVLTRGPGAVAGVPDLDPPDVKFDVAVILAVAVVTLVISSGPVEETKELLVLEIISCPDELSLVCFSAKVFRVALVSDSVASPTGV